MRFQAQGDDGDDVIVTVTEVTPDEVTIDANHPLAGQVLNFEVEIVAVRECTPEELEHGHIHGPEGHHHAGVVSGERRRGPDRLRRGVEATFPRPPATVGNRATTAFAAGRGNVEAPRLLRSSGLFARRCGNTASGRAGPAAEGAMERRAGGEAEQIADLTDGQLRIAQTAQRDLTPNIVDDAAVAR